VFENVDVIALTLSLIFGRSDYFSHVVFDKKPLVMIKSRPT
jgi:hypothetical protein